MNLLFKNKNYTLVFLGFLVSSIGDVLFNFAIGLYILDITHSALSLSIYGAIGGITWLVLAPFGGVLVDRWDRVKIIYITDLIRGITMFVCGLTIVATDHVPTILGVLYVTTFIISVNGALFGPAAQSIIPMIVEKDELMEANSLISLMYSTKDVLSLLLAGILYGVLGPVMIVFINGISYVASGISEMFIRVKGKRSKKTDRASHILEEMQEGLRYIWIENKQILLILLIINGVSLAITPIQSLVIPYVLNEQFQAPNMHLSLVYVAAALGGVIGSIGASKIKKARGFKIHYLFITLMIALGTQACTITMLYREIISYQVYVVTVWLSFLIIGAVNMLYHIPVYTSVQKLIPQNYYGRIMSLFSMLSSVSIPMSMTVGGYLIDVYGVGLIYLLAIITMLMVLQITRRSTINDKL